MKTNFAELCASLSYLDASEYLLSMLVCLAKVCRQFLNGQPNTQNNLLEVNARKTLQFKVEIEDVTNLPYLENNLKPMSCKRNLYALTFPIKMVFNQFGISRKRHVNFYGEKWHAKYSIEICS